MLIFRMAHDCLERSLRFSFSSSTTRALSSMIAVVRRCGLWMLLKMWIISFVISSPSGFGGKRPAARKAVSTGMRKAREMAIRVDGWGRLFPLMSLLITARFRSAERAQSDWDQPRRFISDWSHSANCNFRPTENILSQSLFLWGADLLQYVDRLTLEVHREILRFHSHGLLDLTVP